ncbi:MAG: hypothetical protein ACKVTZ_01965 [Bacteroidia bacterium]
MIDKSHVGIIRNKKEWETLNPSYSPAECLEITEFLRLQYLILFQLPTKIDKTIVGFRKPKRKRKVK